jgi:hypothetical protein
LKPAKGSTAGTRKKANKDAMLKENYKTAVYSVSIDLPESPADIFKHLIELGKWWPESFSGEDIKPGSEFVFTTGDSHYSKNKVTDFVPGKKLAWEATEAIRKTDNYDWTGTKFIFELTSNGTGTQLKFTYDGVILKNESDRLAQICEITVKDLFYNFITKQNKSYTAAIEVINSPEEVFRDITAHVSKWWGGKDLSGNSINLHDEFIVDHPGAHYSKQKLAEVIPAKKLVWHVTESNLSWLKNKEEWTDTKMIFEIIQKQHSTLLQFTHKGLTPEKESYEKCSQGWNMVIKDWLYTLLTYGKAHF